MPRSPSTVRVTGVGATTSRASSACSGSTSTTECTSVVAPPTSTTTTSPTAVASSSTPVSTTSGVAPLTMLVKSARLLRCLPPMTWERNTSRIALRAPAGARTPILGTTLSASTCGRSPRIALTSSRASTFPATTVGPRQPPSLSPRAARRIGSWLPPSVPPVSSTTSGASPVRSSSWPWATARTVTTLPPLDSATRRPASAVTSSSLPTTATRSPPPAEEQASTSAPVARGSARASSARHASYPSRTSVSIVVRCSAPATTAPVARSTSSALVNVEPKSTQTAQLATQVPGRGRRAGPRRSRCRR